MTYGSETRRLGVPAEQKSHVAIETVDEVNWEEEVMELREEGEGRKRKCDCLHTVNRNPKP